MLPARGVRLRIARRHAEPPPLRLRSAAEVVVERAVLLCGDDHVLDGRAWPAGLARSGRGRPGRPQVSACDGDPCGSGAPDERAAGDSALLLGHGNPPDLERTPESAADSLPGNLRNPPPPW